MEPTTTAVASQTPAPSPTACATATPRPTPICLATAAPPTSPVKRPLQVVYAASGQLWLWREETGEATKLAGNVQEPCVLSPDGRLVAFRRPSDSQSDEIDEIWVTGVDGTGEHRVAVSDGQEPGKHPPEYHDPGNELAMGWLPETHTLWYHRRTLDSERAPLPYEHPVRLVNADGGLPCTVVPAGDALALDWRPDGQQMVVLTAQELRLIDTADGRVTHTVPLGLHSESYRLIVRYSPDGRQVLTYVPQALAVVDTASGQRRDIPLDYEPIPVGMGVGAWLPKLYWRGHDQTAYVIVPHGRDVIEWYDKAAFDLWQVDLDQATATQLYTFEGIGGGMSPDGRWLAYWHRANGAEQMWDLYLANAETGQRIPYDQVDLWRDTIWPITWHSDSQRIMYHTYNGSGLQLVVGQLCGSPVAVAQAYAIDPDSDPCFYAVEGRDEFLVCNKQPAGADCIQLVASDGRVRLIAGDAVYVGHWLGD